MGKASAGTSRKPETGLEPVTPCLQACPRRGVECRGGGLSASTERNSAHGSGGCGVERCGECSHPVSTEASRPAAAGPREAVDRGRARRCRAHPAAVGPEGTPPTRRLTRRQPHPLNLCPYRELRSALSSIATRIAQATTVTSCRGKKSRDCGLAFTWLSASGLVLDHFSEGVLELCGHSLLEQRE